MGPIKTEPAQKIKTTENFILIHFTFFFYLPELAALITQLSLQQWCIYISSQTLILILCSQQLRLNAVYIVCVH